MATLEIGEMRALEHIRFITRHFHSLQGLRHLVPLGLILLSAAACYAEGPLLLLAAPPLLAAVLLTLGAHRYYGNAFGQAEPPQAPRPAAAASEVSIFNAAGPAPWLASPPSPISSLQRTVLLLGLAPTLYLLFQNLIAPPWVTFPSGLTLSRPVEWPALGVVPALLLYALHATLFLSLWLMRERRLSQSHYLALGVLLLGLPALSAPPWAAPLLCGCALILAGLLDHWQLVRALGPIPAAPEDES